MNRKAVGVPIFFAFFCFFTHLIYADDFSAKMASSTKEGTFQGKIYVSGRNMRMEMQGFTTITSMDKKMVWVLMPETKMYMEEPFDPHNAAAISEKVPGEIERTLVAEETINGRPAKKYKVLYDAMGDRQVIYQWIDTMGCPVPLKTAAFDDSWAMEYTDISIGKQDSSLFEIPPDYMKMNTDTSRAAQADETGASGGDGPENGDRK